MLLQIGCNFGLSIGFTVTKIALTNGFLLQDFMMCRAVICVGIFSLIMWKNGKSFSEEHLPKEKRWTVFNRAFLSLIALATQNFAYQNIPLSHAIVAFSIFPMISVLIAYFMDNEPILKLEIGGILLGFTGIFIFANGKEEVEGN